MKSEERRIVVIERMKCKPNKCGWYACRNACPVQRAGKKVIEVVEEGKPPVINEELCIGCGICVQACNFKALHVVHLPAPRMADLVFRYGPNAFALYRLPIPVERTVIGILGQNAIGKSTSLKILAGILRPNFGRTDNPPAWDEIIAYFRGSPLQVYFKRLSEEKMRVIYKPQYVDVIPRRVSGATSEVLKKYDERGLYHEVIDKLGMKKFLDTNIKHLSGGELQKLACAVAYLRDADVYMFDEPSSYLDVAERLRVAKLIRDLAEQGKYVLVAEHDLAILDYLSDVIHIYYGEAGAYGIVSPPYSAREGINAFLEGYEKTENVRFREYVIKFSAIGVEMAETPEELVLVKYPQMKKRLGKFCLNVNAGELYLRRVYGVVGPNAIGKTTFVKLLAGILKPDEGKYETAALKISYKPQYLGEFVGELDWVRVIDKLKEANPLAIRDRWYQTYVIKPLGIDKLFDYELRELSGGNLQKVAIACCLARQAHLYLLDEPTAYIDAEDRWRLAKILRTFAEKSGSTLLVVDHDVMFIDYISDFLIVFEGEPEIEGYASKPLGKREGMNRFLKFLGITFRRDKDTLRPRINKPGSRLDRIQKQKGEYYYIGV